MKDLGPCTIEHGRITPAHPVGEDVREKISKIVKEQTTRGTISLLCEGYDTTNLIDALTSYVSGIINRLTAELAEERRLRAQAEESLRGR